jgi:hypothetical protein
MNPTIYKVEVGDQLTVLQRGLPFLHQHGHHGSPTRRWSGPPLNPICCGLLKVDHCCGFRFTSARSTEVAAVDLVDHDDGEKEADGL